MAAPRIAMRLAAAAAAFLGLWLLVGRLPVLHWIAIGARAVQGAGLAGALLWLAAIYALTLVLVPIIPLVVASGWLFGVWGVMVSLPAAVASAATSFSIARALGRSGAAQALLRHPRARAVAELAEQGGIATVALLRVSPLLPFTPGNAVLGLTGLKLRDLVLGTVFGMAPGMVLFAWAGSLLPSAEAIERHELPGPMAWLLVAANFVAAGVIGVAAARKLRMTSRARKLED